MHYLPLRLPKPGPLLEYLQWLHSKDVAKATETRQAIRKALNTPDGRILLELLEKSIEFAAMPILDDPRALAAKNAQAFIAHDLRRIVSNETEQLLARQTDDAGGRRTPGRRGRSD